MNYEGPAIAIKMVIGHFLCGNCATVVCLNQVTKLYIELYKLYVQYMCGMSGYLILLNHLQHWKHDSKNIHLTIQK